MGISNSEVNIFFLISEIILVNTFFLKGVISLIESRDVDHNEG